MEEYIERDAAVDAIVSVYVSTAGVQDARMCMDGKRGCVRIADR